MSCTKKKWITTTWDIRCIADDLEIFARENPTLSQREVKKTLLSCLKAIRDQERMSQGRACDVAQLMAISFVLGLGNFSPELSSKGKSMELFLRQLPHYGILGALSLLDDIHQLIDLLERSL